MTDDIAARCILIIVMVFAASFFAAAETAYSYCNKIRMKSLAESGSRSAARVTRILSDFDGALVTLLIGINVLSVLISSTATVLAISLLKDVAFLSGYASLISTILVTITVFLFDETIPKNIAHVNADRMALLFSLPLWILMVLVHPLVLFFRKISDLISGIFSRNTSAEDNSSEELMRAVDSAEKTRGISHEEARMIRSSAVIRGIAAENIMVPADKADFIDYGKVKNDKEALKNRILSDEHSRHPLCDGNIDNIIGIVLTNDILNHLMHGGPADLKALSRKPVVAPPGQDIGSLYSEMIKNRCHMAVISENGRTRGIVTLNDILKEMFGKGGVSK